MNNRFRKYLLLVNYIAIVFFVGYSMYNTWFLALPAAVRVTALDRAGVFDETKLREFDPKLAENLRGNVGRWIAEGERKVAFNFAYFGLAIGVANVLGLHLARRKQP